MPLKRKLLTDPSAEAAALRAKQWTVEGYCSHLWEVNRVNAREDTFIGLIDRDTCILYLAPCFGITGQECLRVLGKAAEDGTDMRRLRIAVSRFQRLSGDPLPGDLKLVIGSTSVDKDNARTTTWGKIKGFYPQGACLVPWFLNNPGFDGNSHRSLVLWVENSTQIERRPGQDFGTFALGFAIQRDKQGYFVRFASMYNQKYAGLGGDGYDVFEPPLHKPWFGSDTRPKKGVNEILAGSKEPRDLPKEWAMKLVQVLARDLKMGCLGSFERIVSRTETQTTKLQRLQDLGRLT